MIWRVLILLLLQSCAYVYTVDVHTPRETMRVTFEDRQGAELQICYHEGHYFFSHYHPGHFMPVQHCCRGARWFELVNCTRKKSKVKL